ncbi:2Fe-2S iron-sulfur cluster-binding protein [Paraburkholderia susongensis]|uniref:2Fe-2S iron-sulfur cluster binding domain-containing protein n=1 Tax=Paraburkholderia susongensis TaxID=1515439 RepID=A0A1X7LP34_9BURK|nr:2Fe-2S iron-sulfur cluster binding domain-containing protein [Paraburkholderia susongensis]
MNIFFWKGTIVEFFDGETVASALARYSIRNLGRSASGEMGRYFCGIGQCQGCVVSINGGAPVESCLTPALQNSQVTPGAF